MTWVMKKQGLPEAIVRAVMSLYHGAKTKVRVRFELSQEFLVQVGVQQRVRYWIVQNEMRGVLGRVSVRAAGRILDSANPREIRT